MKREYQEQALGKTLAAWQVEMATDDLEDMMARARGASRPERSGRKVASFAGRDLGLFGPDRRGTGEVPSVGSAGRREVEGGDAVQGDRRRWVRFRVGRKDKINLTVET